MTTQHMPTRNGSQAHLSGNTALRRQLTRAPRRQSTYSTSRTVARHHATWRRPIQTTPQANAHRVEDSRNGRQSTQRRRGPWAWSVTTPASSTHTPGSARIRGRSIVARAAGRHMPTITHESRCLPRCHLLVPEYKEIVYRLKRVISILPSCTHPTPQHAQAPLRHRLRLWEDEPPLPRLTLPLGRVGRPPHAPPPLHPMRVRGRHPTPRGAH